MLAGIWRLKSEKAVDQNGYNGSHAAKGYAHGLAAAAIDFTESFTKKRQTATTATTG